MKYDVYGEFEIPRGKTSRIDANKATLKEFWETIDSRYPGLSDACGCYIYSIRGKVWYVGMASKQSFRKEAFTSHKLVKYNEALSEVSGNPQLILLARLTNTGRFSNPSSNGHRDIELLENLLIGSAIARNPKLLNIKNTKHLNDMEVPGVINTKQGVSRRKSVQALKQSLGL